MNCICRSLVVFLLSSLVAPPICFSAPGQRLALVIGNSAYATAPLKNSANDARDMAIKLQRLGFHVTLKTNASRRAMHSAINSFGKQLREGGAGLFYYAGHGLQVRGHNYLIPVGAQIESESDVEYETVDAGRVLGKMEDAGNGLNIIILDACRNNPFARSFRSGNSGLAKMDAPTGSILAFSTAPGSVAADGEGRNGLYTSKLLKHMATPNITIETVFKRVRIDVARASGKKQTPWESSSLMGDFFFSQGKSGAPQTARAIQVQANRPPQTLNAEEEMWAVVKTSESIEDYNLFLDEYPDSRFRGAATLKIQQIKRNKNAQVMTAAISPASVDTNRAEDQNALRRIYTLAMLPVKTQSTYGGDGPVMESRAIRGIAAMIGDDEKLELAYTYKKIGTIYQHAKLLSDVVESDDVQIWERKSFFAKSEPSWEKVKKLRSRLNARLAVLVNANYSSGVGKVDLYLYDYERDTVYSVLDVAYHSSSMVNAIKGAASGLMTEFYRSHQ